MSNTRKLELQRVRRAQPGVKESENAKERGRYKALPKDHPRKNRSDRHTKELNRRKAEKDWAELPNHVVARRYLHLRVKDCPTELIGLKREVMKLNRMLGIQIHTMNNIEKLREHVAETCKRLERKEIGAEEAMAVSRAASAVIGSLRVEIQYRQARAEKPEIGYFESNA